MAIIAHIDLDSFFASCERIRNPDLEGKGIVICMYSGRGEDGGAVSTSDYNARELGIHAGMPIVHAKEIAADADINVEFLPADKTYYTTVSEQVRDIILEHVDDIEVASVDEAYADVSDVEAYDKAAERMVKIREQIKEQVGVTASAGIGPNKLVAKMASDEDKPDGLTVIRPEQVTEFFSGLPVKELHGIGPKTADKLKDIGAETVDDLREIPVQRLIREFGETRGIELHNKANGKGEKELTERTKKQLSRIQTLNQDTRSMSEIRPVIRELADDVITRLENRDQRYTRVSAIIVTDELDTRTRTKTLKSPVQSVQKLFRNAERLTTEFIREQEDITVRRIGVGASGFEDGSQKNLADF